MPCSGTIQLGGFIFAVGFYSVIKGEIDPQLPFFSDEVCFHLQGYISTQNTSFRMLSANRHTESSAKYVCTSQPVVHQSP
jgi:hypothetical protein